MHTNKDVVAIVALVGAWRVEGHMHVLSGSRLTDSLNSRSKDFIAVTEARVFDAGSGALLMESPYLALNRVSIDMVLNSD